MTPSIELRAARAQRTDKALTSQTFQLGPLDLQLHPGQIHALLGENGSGKSTTLALLTGQIPLLDGEFLIYGKPAADAKPRHRAQSIALVPQSENTPHGYTVRQTVLLGRVPWSDGLWETPQDHQAADQAIQTVNLQPKARQPLDTLSGGERQRVLIARALTQNNQTQNNQTSPSLPRVLLLDEPTASLDAYHRAQLATLLRNLARDGQTILLTSHDINWAARLASHVTLLHQGRPIANGPTSHTLTPQNLQQTFGVPFQTIPLPDSPPGATPIFIPIDHTV